MDNNGKVLFISINDGSDTRIRKELKTLTRQGDVIFVGALKDNDISLNKVAGVNYNFIKGNTSNVSSYFKLFFLVLKLRFRFFRKIRSVHVINETCLISCYLAIIGLPIILDIFDSIFLKRLQFLKDSFIEKLIHSIPKKILVTDDNRKELIAEKQRDKVIVLPNYPFLKDAQDVVPLNNGKINIAYVGSLEKARGSDFLNGLISVDKDDKIMIHMIGWVYDSDSELLKNQDQVSFYGVLEQSKALSIIGQCDYLLSLYEPKSLNNINASPNKIFDGILQEVPVIINSEVKVSSLVSKLGIGYLLKNYFSKEYELILADLIKLKGTYFKNKVDKFDYCWESVENNLIKVHFN